MPVWTRTPAAKVFALFGQLEKRVEDAALPEILDKLQNGEKPGLRLMDAAFGDILSFKEVLEAHGRRIDALGDAAEATALAALYLAEHLAPTAPQLAERFTERSMSLTRTVAQIRSGAALRGSQTEQPLQLIATIQNVALVMVPGWLGGIAALSGLMDASRQPTPTEARELANQLRTILQQFKR